MSTDFYTLLASALVIGVCLFIYLTRKENPIVKAFEPKEGEYSHIDVCPNCKNVLSDRQIYYAMGRCAHCGHKGEGAGTITDSDEIVVRYSRERGVWLAEEEYAKTVIGNGKKVLEKIKEFRDEFPDTDTEEVKQIYTKEEMIEELKKYREFVWRNGATAIDLERYIKDNF